MRLRRVKNALETVENSKYIILKPEESRGKFNLVFGNNNPIYLEIGMGKEILLFKMLLIILRIITLV